MVKKMADAEFFIRKEMLWAYTRNMQIEGEHLRLHTKLATWSSLMPKISVQTVSPRSLTEKHLADTMRFILHFTSSCSN
jgi:hypothetical protein